MNDLDACINEVLNIKPQDSLFIYNRLVEKTIRKYWDKDDKAEINRLKHELNSTQRG